MGWSYFPIGIVCPVISEEPKSNIDLDLLKQKSFAFLSQNPEYRKYDVRYEAYGMEDI